MYKIIVMGTYFGNWPKWFPAFFLSCQTVKDIDWLFFTDCPIPNVTCPHIKFIPMNLEQLNHLASEKLGFPIQKDSYSQLDIRPAYGVIFEEYFTGYDFWGHCDFDVIWGNIRHFITDSILNQHQIISSRKDQLAGHFTLWKNEPKTNTLFKFVPEYRQAFSNAKHVNFDEHIMSKFLANQLTSNNDIKIYWSKKIVVGRIELKNKPKGWYWKNGKIFDKENQEHIYIHFMPWKASMKKIDFQLGSQPERFIITRRGIWSHRMPIIERFLEITQLFSH